MDTRKSDTSLNPSDPSDDRGFDALLLYLKQSRGFDFSGYKRSSLQRRIQKQMQLRNITSFTDYVDYLEVYPDEFVILFNAILINVTAFFRDASAWDHLSSHVLAPLLQAVATQDPIRVWDAGCASGEEAYTLVIVLAELLGIEQFRQRVKIYATDVDEEALVQARVASYSTQDLKSVPVELQEKYFEPAGGRYGFRADLRRCVIFGRHDLLQDAPISRLDLLVCRNTLMYFNAETQGRILERFHFGLKDSGVLFLGRAEMLLTHAKLFAPLSLPHRIFSRVAKLHRRNHQPLVMAQSDEVSTMQLQNAALNAVPLSQLIIDHQGRLAMANTHACHQFKITVEDLGKLLQDLELSYRPVELRSRIEQVYADRHPILIPAVARPLVDGTVQYLDVQLTPLAENGGDLLGISITFTDITEAFNLQAELQQANQALAITNEKLLVTNETLETTNEELQSTNEELETTNEELESSNEELETINEELQSTNAELQDLNHNLQERTWQVDQANAFLKSILESIQAGVVVIDSDGNILSWNAETENLWGLRLGEVAGQSLFELDIGLPVEQLREPIRACLAGENHLVLVLDAVNRRGRSFRCRVRCNPLSGPQLERQGVILVMEAVEP